MKLNQLIVQGNKKLEKNSGLKPLFWKFHHITELFIEFLPKIDIDGSSKIVIYADKNQQDTSKYICDKYFGVSIYYLEENQIEELKNEQTDECMTRLVEESLIDIAKRNDVEDSIIYVIEETADKIRNLQYSTRKRITKLSKKSPCGSFRVDVYRCLSRELGESWFVEIEDKNKRLLRKQWITEVPGHLDRLDFFKKSIWEDGKFVLKDNLDKTVKCIDCNVFK